jgi:protein transport protein SEC61 subunit beta
MSSRGILAKKTQQQQGSSGKSTLANLFKIYTDDTPGIKVGPTTVLVISLIYMAIVVVLHILAKIRAVTTTTGEKDL